MVRPLTRDYRGICKSTNNCLTMPGYGRKSPLMKKSSKKKSMMKGGMMSPNMMMKSMKMKSKMM